MFYLGVEHLLAFSCAFRHGHNVRSRSQGAPKDMKASGKSVNVKNVGAVLRKENDDELVRHAACLFASWVPAFQGALGKAGMDELMDRFLRGAVDRELFEKVKSCDEGMQF